MNKKIHFLTRLSITGVILQGDWTTNQYNHSRREETYHLFFYCVYIKKATIAKKKNSPRFHHTKKHSIQKNYSFKKRVCLCCDLCVVSVERERVSFFLDLLGQKIIKNGIFFIYVVEREFVVLGYFPYFFSLFSLYEICNF